MAAGTPSAEEQVKNLMVFLEGAHTLTQGLDTIKTNLERLGWSASAAEQASIQIMSIMLMKAS